LSRIGEFLDLGIGDAEVLKVLHGHADLIVGNVCLLMAVLFSQLLPDAV